MIPYKIHETIKRMAQKNTKKISVTPEHTAAADAQPAELFSSRDLALLKVTEKDARYTLEGGRSSVALIYRPVHS